MTKSCWMHRYSSAFSLLLFLRVQSGLAAEVSLPSFEAIYELYSSGTHVADTRLSLKRDNQQNWWWRTSVRPRGIASIFTRKKPYADTLFSQDSDGFRIHQIKIGNHRSEAPDELVNFDWESGVIKVLRKGKQTRAELPGETYDYQSIHLVAAKMIQENIQERTVFFYRKGKVRQSTLAARGPGSMTVKREDKPALIFDQTIQGSRSTIRYYYDEKNPVLPLRIEKSKSGERQSTMILQRIKWTP